MATDDDLTEPCARCDASDKVIAALYDTISVRALVARQLLDLLAVWQTSIDTQQSILGSLREALDKLGAPPLPPPQPGIVERVQ